MYLPRLLEVFHQLIGVRTRFPSSSDASGERFERWLTGLLIGAGRRRRKKPARQERAPAANFDFEI